MARPTNTTAQTIFERTDPSAPNNYAIFELQNDPARPGLTRITLPPKSTWTPGPHWHERYTEFFRVVQGKVVIKLDGVTKVVGPEDGTQRVDKFIVHEFMRADKDSREEEKDIGDVITEEWTDPMDGAKHVFFRNAFSTLQDGDKYWKSWTMVQALFICTEYDNFIVILPGALSHTTTHVLYGVLRLAGRLLGLRAWCDEYTPASLRPIAAGSKLSKQD